MTKKCSVPTCGNSYPKTKNVCIIDEVNCKLTPITYHIFPKNPMLRKKWIKATGRYNWSPSDSGSYICSEHFRESDFAIEPSRISETAIDELQKVRRLLKKDAFPTQLLGTVISTNTLADQKENQQVSSTRQLSDEYHSSENAINSTTNSALIPESEIKVEPEEENIPQDNLVPLTSSILVKEEINVNYNGICESKVSINESGRSNFHINGLNLGTQLTPLNSISLEQKYEKLKGQYLSLKKDYDIIKIKYDIQSKALQECERILKECR